MQVEGRHERKNGRERNEIQWVWLTGSSRETKPSAEGGKNPGKPQWGGREPSWGGGGVRVHVCGDQKTKRRTGRSLMRQGCAEGGAAAKKRRTNEDNHEGGRREWERRSRDKSRGYETGFPPLRATHGNRGGGAGIKIRVKTERTERERRGKKKRREKGCEPNV